MTYFQRAAQSLTFSRLVSRSSGRAETGPLLGPAAAGASARPDAAALPDGSGAAPARR